jgi:hypothetical protein
MPGRHTLSITLREVHRLVKESNSYTYSQDAIATMYVLTSGLGARKLLDLTAHLQCFALSPHLSTPRPQPLPAPRCAGGSTASACARAASRDRTAHIKLELCGMVTAASRRLDPEDGGAAPTTSDDGGS